MSNVNYKFINLDPKAQRPRPGVYNQPQVYVPKNKNILNSPNLSIYFGTIEDQLNLGSCSSFSSTQWYSAWRVKKGFSWVEYSELAQYWETRNFEGTTNIDSGGFLHDAVRSLETFGVMNESDDSYNTSAFTNKPDESKFIVGSQLPSELVKQIDPNNILHDALDALDNGYPLLFGFVVFAALTSPEVAQTGILPMPNADELSNEGHAVVAVYNDKVNKRILIRNQWGKQWGISKDGTKSNTENGYFWMSYDYFSKFVWECYVIEDSAAPTPNPQPQPIPTPSTGTQITLWIDNPVVDVNGTSENIGVAPKLFGDFTLVPLRFISEAFGAKVDWYQDEKKIVITKQ